MVINSINRESTLELLKEFNFPITTKKTETKCKTSAIQKI